MKAAVFDSAEGCIDTVSIECRDVLIKGDRVEVPMSSYWDAVVQCVRQIAARGRARLEDIRALSVSSQSRNFMPA